MISRRAPPLASRTHGGGGAELLAGSAICQEPLPVHQTVHVRGDGGPSVQLGRHLAGKGIPLGT